MQRLPLHRSGRQPGRANPRRTGQPGETSHRLPDYKGKAKDAEGFIRESIVTPSAYLHPGPMFSANGMSFMPDTFGKSLTPEQIDQLVAYLASFQ